MTTAKNVAAFSTYIRDVGILARNFTADSLVSLLPRPRRTPEGKESILLVRLDAIGDFVLWLDAARALRTLYPPERCRLVLLGNDLWTDLALQQHCFDEVIPVDVKRSLTDFRYRLSLWRRLRRTAWATAINPTYSRHMPYDDAAIRVCGAEERIGFVGDRSNQRGWEMKISNGWYSSLLPAFSGQLMELERNAEFMRALGMTGFRAGVPTLELPGAPPERAAGDAYFVVVPGASLPLKQWPVENFAELVRKVCEAHPLKAVICGSAGERELGRRLRGLLQDRVEVRDLSGATTLAEFAAVIKGARFVVANDSSAVHIAAAVGTRAFCLSGGGHFGRFVPYRPEKEVSTPLPVVIAHRMECFHCKLDCRYCGDGAAAPCLTGITVEAAWDAVREALGAESAS